MRSMERAWIGVGAWMPREGRRAWKERGQGREEGVGEEVKER